MKKYIIPLIITTILLSSITSKASGNCTYPQTDPTFLELTYKEIWELVMTYCKADPLRKINMEAYGSFQHNVRACDTMKANIIKILKKDHDFDEKTSEVSCKGYKITTKQ